LSRVRFSARRIMLPNSLSNIVSTASVRLSSSRMPVAARSHGGAGRAVRQVLRCDAAASSASRSKAAGDGRGRDRQAQRAI
jgi:hypothetical protein